MISYPRSFRKRLREIRHEGCTAGEGTSSLQGYPVRRDKTPEACRVRLVANEPRRAGLRKEPREHRRNLPSQMRES
jgi:hypothetical protein